MTVPAPVDPALATAAVDEFFDLPLWKDRIVEYGWAISCVDHRTLIVAMRAREIDGEREQYTLRLSCDHYPTWPPDARFVNPATLAYDPAQDQRYLPALVAPFCYMHPVYPYQQPYVYGPQLVCSSMTLGYYFGHTPQEHERWDAGRYTIGSTIYTIHRALHSEYYKGRMP